MMYAVTFCTMDQDAGGNPLWHSCILLSQMNEERKLLEVCRILGRTFCTDDWLQTKEADDECPSAGISYAHTFQ